MGVNEFLAGLDMEQLLHVRSQVYDLIKAKEDETTRVIWQVCNAWSILGYFAAEDYPLAAAYLAHLAAQQHASLPITNVRKRQLELKAIRVIESEYQADFASVIAADRAAALDVPVTFATQIAADRMVAEACITATGNAPQQG